MMHQIFRDIHRISLRINGNIVSTGESDYIFHLKYLSIETTIVKRFGIGSCTIDILFLTISGLGEDADLNQ
jgi:hypothetical protein